MSVDPAFAALCVDPYAEPMDARIYVRLNDEDGLPATLLELTATQEVVDMSAIEQRREHDFGVVQAQAWQVQITNRDHELLALALKDCWAAARAGFRTANQWETFAQGKIKRFQVSTGGMATIEVHDAVMDLVGAALTRTMRFQTAGWVSPMEVEAKAVASKSWNPLVSLVLNTPASADDETFVIEFTSPTAFKVILENGDETQTGTIASNKTIANVVGDAGIITIPAAGWSTDSGAYATGDRFIFFTSAARLPDVLTPVYMVKHLIEVVLGLEVYDVLGGAAYGSPLYDTSYWSTHGEAAVSAGNYITGTFPRGTSIAAMIQDALKMVHGSIYPTETGQIGLWVPVPSSATAIRLNGDFGQGPVDILENATYEDLSDDAIRAVTYKYRTADGGEASYTAVDPDARPTTTKHVTVDVAWECVGSRVKDMADRYLMRFREGQREYVCPTTLAGYLASVGSVIGIYEGELGLAGRTADVTACTRDVLANTATVRARVDRYVNANIFILDQSLLDGPEVLK